MDSRWSPPNPPGLPGVHLEYVEQGKVLLPLFSNLLLVAVGSHCGCSCSWAVVSCCGHSWVVTLSKNDWSGLGHIVVTPVHENV